MAITTAGELFGYKAPTAGNTVEIPIVLTDADGVKTTGIAFDAAGMAVSTRKEGAHSFTAFPTFDTNNWAECGYGEYVIILRQSDAGELALMDTEGTLTFYVICTATAGDFAKIKVNPADVARDDQWTDARAGYLTAAVATATAATAISNAIAALENLSQAEAEDACDTALGTYGAAVPGDEMDLIDAPNSTAITAIQAGLAEAGDEMDLIDAPNATAVTAIQAGLAVPGDEMDLVDAPNATAMAALAAAIAAALPSAGDNADAVFDEVLGGHTAPGSFGEALDPASAGSLAEKLTWLFYRLLTCVVTTEDIDGNAVMVVKDAVGGSTVATINFDRSGLVTTMEVQP